MVGGVLAGQNGSGVGLDQSGVRQSLPQYRKGYIGSKIGSLLYTQLWGTLLLTLVRRPKDKPLKRYCSYYRAYD